jgi:type III secretory pathway component EscU
MLTAQRQLRANPSRSVAKVGVSKDAIHRRAKKYILQGAQGIGGYRRRSHQEPQGDDMRRQVISAPVIGSRAGKLPHFTLLLPRGDVHG